MEKDLYTMTKEELTEYSKEINNEYINAKKDLYNRVMDMLQGISPKPIFRRDMGSLVSSYDENQYQFEYQVRVGFEVIGDGGIKSYDFGSDFYFCVTERGVEINKGTCGTYSSRDTYQAARDILIGKLWGIEQEFVELFNSRKERLIKLDSLSCSITGRLDEIEYKERLKTVEEKREEFYSKLKEGIDMEYVLGSFIGKVTHITKKYVHVMVGSNCVKHEKSELFGMFFSNQIKFC